MLKAIGNIIWLLLAGIPLAIAYALAGVIACITIIGIPFGVAAFRMTSLVVWPFGRTAVRRADAGVGSAVGNVVWFVLCGWWLALIHIGTSIALFITIIGIPLALGNLKMVPISIRPFGREIVPTDGPGAVSAYGS